MENKSAIFSLILFQVYTINSVKLLKTGDLLMMEEKESALLQYDVIVIGGGLSGLTAGRP